MSSRGERIQQALEARSIKKQHALAHQLGVHESAITRWKDGKSISLDNAASLCVALDVSLDWIILGRGTMDSHKLESATFSALPQEGLAVLAFPGLSAGSLDTLARFLKSVREDVLSASESADLR
jgi:transcriptional regulator with XRE-family HTH domain